MKYCIVILITGILAAAEMQNWTDIPVDCVTSRQIACGRQQTIVDSCRNGNTLWGQMHECISYNRAADAMGIVNRNFNPTGILNYHSAPGHLSFWVHDYAVYNADFGNARYPTSIAGTTGPYLSFPWLVDPPAWGGAGGQYCSGGWFTSFWDDPVDLGPGDQCAMRVIGKESPDGNLCFILCSTAPWGLQYRTYTSDLSSLLDYGWLTPNDRHYYYWGYDVNESTAYVFYYDDSLHIYYCTNTGGGWNGPFSYNMVWPEPYTDNVISFKQMAVTDAGNPLLVFDNQNGADTTYPYYSKVYISHTEGQPCVEVSSTFGAPDTESFYCTIATGKDYAAVIYNTPRNNLNDSLCWNDIFINWSTDNGVTWGIPENLTYGNDSLHFGVQQLAKRIDTLRNRVYFVYAAADYDPYWTPGVPIYICFDYAPRVGIEETALRLSPHVLRLLDVFPNPFSKQTNIKFQIPNSETQATIKIFDATGQLIRQFDDATIRLSDQIIWQGDEPTGIYFVYFEGNDFSSVQKVVKLE